MTDNKYHINFILIGNPRIHSNSTKNLDVMTCVKTNPIIIVKLYNVIIVQCKPFHKYIFQRFLKNIIYNEHCDVKKSREFRTPKWTCDCHMKKLNGACLYLKKKFRFREHSIIMISGVKR